MTLVLITILFLSFVVAQEDLTTSNRYDDSEDEIENESDDERKNRVELETENEDEDSELRNTVSLRENFCGTSTLATCEEDEDCIVGGCSQAVCQGASEEPAITTCEFRECYNATKYDAECKCEDKKCQWDRVTESEIKNITKEKNRIRFNVTNKNDCPKNCTCSGSAVKCFINGTREMTINAGNSGNLILQIKGINATTNVTLYKSDDGKLYVVNDNNETTEIKFLPDEVREKIMERKQFENEEIELDENGTYEYRAEKRAKLFFLFSVKEKVEARIDSETGEVLELKNPWWSFLAKDEEEIDEDLSGGTMLAGSESNLTDEELAAA
jgi:eight-cysteine-cluster-containing protein